MTIALAVTCFFFGLCSQGKALSQADSGVTCQLYKLLRRVVALCCSVAHTWLRLTSITRTEKQ